MMVAMGYYVFFLVFLSSWDARPVYAATPNTSPKYKQPKYWYYNFTEEEVSNERGKAMTDDDDDGTDINDNYDHDDDNNVTDSGCRRPPLRPVSD